MKRSVYPAGLLYGMLTGLVVMALAILGNAIAAFPFFPFDLFDWLARHLPGRVIDTVIQGMVSVITALGLGPTDAVAKLAEQIQSLALVWITGMGFGLALAWVRQKRPGWLRRAGLLGGLALWLGLAVVELTLPGTSPAMAAGLAWLLGLMLGWGWWLARLTAAGMGAPAAQPAPGGPPPAQRSLDRKEFWALAGSALAGLAVLALGLRSFRGQARGAPASAPAGGEPDLPGGATAAPAIYGPDTTSGPAASPGADVLAARMEAAPGTRAEITPVDQFYRIDINALPVKLDAQSWKLELKGLVEKPLTFTLDEIRARPAVTQAVTLSCVSNPLAGDLISTNFWTGVPLKDVLALAGVRPGAKGVAITAADGYYEWAPLDEAMDGRTLLVYAMNGVPLTMEHGFPLRIFIPNHYGMKQPKWITALEVTGDARGGFWGERGWEPLAIPKTTSVIDTYTVDREALQKTGIMPLGGIAWAGARGIQKVEIKIDDGSWVEAVLRSPAVSPLTWVQWRYDWKPGPYAHSVMVRATDGDGALQISTPSNPGPEGATGIHSVFIMI